MHNIRYINNLDKIRQLESEEIDSLLEVTGKYKFRASDYYLSLINWDNPRDPLRKIIIPQSEELDEWGELDASSENFNYVSRGLQHKYKDTVLLLTTNTCASFCRFCFRKRLFMADNSELDREIDQNIDYIAHHPEINNILLSGGDPLMLSTEKLEMLLCRLREIPHLNIIRIGSKLPVFNPYRILDDPGLLDLIRRTSTPRKRIYLITHVNHPRELAPPTIEAIDLFHQAGAVLCNQSPILNGINDDVETLTDLMGRLSGMGVVPYYFFINRPTRGNKPFCVPVTKAYRLFITARRRLSGLSRRSRLIMSHSQGKVEIMGLDTRKIYMRFHRARNPIYDNRIMVFNRDDKAFWFDDFLLQKPVKITETAQCN